MQIRSKSQNLFFLLLMTLSVITLSLMPKVVNAEGESLNNPESTVVMKEVKLIIDRVTEEKSGEGYFIVKANFLNKNEVGFQNNLPFSYYFKFTKEQLGIFMPQNGKILETFKEKLVITVSLPEDSILFQGDVTAFMAENVNELEKENAFIFDVRHYTLYLESLVEDLGINENQRGVDLNVTLESMRILEDNNEYYMYDFKDAEDNLNQTELGLDRLVFQNRRVMSSEHPEGENLVGKRVRIWGVVSTTDSKTIEARKWIILDQEYEGTKTETFGPEKTIYGYFQNENSETEVEYAGNKAKLFTFFDFNGKKYDIVVPRLANFPSRLKTLVPYKITGSVSGSSGSTELLLFTSYEELEDDFEYRDSEIVSFYGTIEEQLTSQDSTLSDSSARVTYNFAYQNKNYVAVFDTELLGKSKALEIQDLKGQIVISGIVTTHSNIRYISVLSYEYVSEVVATEYADLGKFQEEETLKQKTFSGNIIQYVDTFKVGLDMYQIYYFLTKEGFRIQIASKVEDQIGLYAGDSVSINVFYSKELYEQGLYIVSAIERSESLFVKHRGTVTSIIEEGTTTCTVNFKTVTGATMKTVIDSNNGKSCESLTNEYIEIYGKESISNEHGMIFLTKYYYVLPKENGILKVEGDRSVTFNGYIQKVIKTTSTSMIVLATNQYGYEEYLELDATYMDSMLTKLDVSLNYLYKTELSFTGYRMDSGVIFVMDLGFIEIPKEYPASVDYKFEILDYFPNMNHWEGVLDISDLGGQANQLMLVTKSDKFVLFADSDTRALIEANLKEYVCLRGEYREGGKPYWTGQIVVYDFVVEKCSDGAEPENIPQKRPDPQKEAHYTYQYHDDPKEFIYGNAILEALYFPEVIESKDSPPVESGLKK